MKRLTVPFRSLKYQLWLYFALFAAFIMAVLWLLQIMFLNTFYEQMKLRQIESLGNSIVQKYGAADFEDLIQQYAFQNGVIIQIFDQTGTELFSSNLFRGGPPRSGEFGRNQRMLHEIQRQLQQYGGNTAFVQDEEFMRTHAAAYIAQLTDETGSPIYLYLNSPLAPVDATTQILQNQLLIVTFAALIAAFILAYFISRKLSKPIADITASARQLGAGDYSVQFRGGGYAEIDQLSDALNHTAAALSRTDQLRRDLIANVSHDLRTPLTIIKSYAEMIRDISGGNAEKRNQHAGVIVEETDRLSLLVSDILDLSKMEAGTTTLDLEPFDLSQLTQDIIRRFEGFAEAYQFETQLDHPTPIIADRKRMEQVLYNLLINAMHYTGEDKRVAIRIITQENTVQLSVTDTGCGIADDELPLVWDRYYKSSRNSGRSSIGSGIGLSIVKNVLLLHHAAFGVDSTVGQGSTFWFQLKKAQQ